MPDKNTFWISDADKEWVHDSFSWLIQAYGYPHRVYKTILFTEEFFPVTFSNRQVDAGALLTDLCNLLGIPENKLSYDLEEDVRDSYGMPYEIQGPPFETALEAENKDGETHYHLVIAKKLLKHPGRLLLNLIIETVKAKQLENKISLDNVEEVDLLMFHVAIYFGYGVLLYQNLVDLGISSDGFWETKWHYTSAMPIPVMAYALALYYDLVEQKEPAWKDALKPDLQKQFIKACAYIQQSGNPLFNKQELTARDAYRSGQVLYDKNDFKNAITEFQKALFATQDDYLKADIYNFIGYTHLRLQEFQKSIFHFQKALELRPGYGYASDNLGFAFIMSGDPDSGKYYLNIALQTNENDAAYSFRNFALYHQAKKEYALAEEYFQKSFNNIVIPVDLLEYFYARFLFETGQKDKGMEFLRKAVEKGEPEAIVLMEKM